MAELTGRELDAEVSKRVFKRLFPSRPRFSFDIEAAWRVAEKIREQTGVLTLAWIPVLAQWGCVYREEAGWREMGMADTAPEAICLAALEVFPPERENAQACD